MRLPEGLRAALEEEARVAGRSLNGEIVRRLVSSAPKSNADAKRELVLDSLLEAAAEVVRWWDALEDEPKAEEYKASLESAMDDLDMWLTRLNRLDSK